jgi:ABC-type spermidine/putrescine transport system permease subunit I
MGATRWQAFARVTLPLSLGGVVAGASIVFSLALNIFVVPRIIGGPSYLVLSSLAFPIFAHVAFDVTPDFWSVL